MIDIFIISYSKSEAAELSWLQLWGETTFFCHPAATVESEEAEDGFLTHNFSRNLPA